MQRSRDVGPRRLQEVAAQCALWREADRMHNAVEPIQMRLQPLGEAVEVIRVGYIELDDRSLRRQPLRDPLDEAESPVSSEDDLRSLLLRDPGDVEGDRRVGDDPRHQDLLAIEDAHACPTSLIWPVP